MRGSSVFTEAVLEADRDAAWDYVRHGHLPGRRTVLKGRMKPARPLLPSVVIEPSGLSSILENSLKEAMGNMAGRQRAIMFSGGFDSILMACMARQQGAQVAAVTVQFDGFNPLTVAGAVKACAQLGLKHHGIEVKAVEFLSAFEDLASITREPLLDLDLAVVHAALRKYDPQTAGNVFISGMGSDQWFGNEAFKASPLETDLRLDGALLDQDAHQQAAKRQGCEFIFPFLSVPMLSLSALVPLALKKDKKLLRGLAAANHIPSQGTRSEVQVPALMRQALVRTYGQSAWPGPVLDQPAEDAVLRQIVLGLWLRQHTGKK